MRAGGVIFGDRITGGRRGDSIRIRIMETAMFEELLEAFELDIREARGEELVGLNVSREKLAEFHGDGDGDAGMRRKYVLENEQDLKKT